MKRLALVLFCANAFGAVAWTPERFPALASRDADYFRSLAPQISGDAFKKKWKRALKAPENLFTSFPSAFYDDFSKLSELGPVGPCFGDPHFRNFGYLRFEHGDRFAYDDLDDSGLCPVAIDALRFFVSLRLSDLSVPTKLEALYEQVASGASDGQSIDETADLKKVRAKLIEQETHHGHFRTDASTFPVTRAKREQVRAALSGKNYRVLDVAGYEHRHGGSAGLEREWALVELPSGHDDILELKLEIDPATSRGPWGTPPSPRIEWAAKHFWPGLKAKSLSVVHIAHREFLVRSRSKADVEWDSLGAGETGDFLRAEATLLAKAHRETWKRDPAALRGIGAWLEKASRDYAARVRKIFDEVSDDGLRLLDAKLAP